MKGGKKVERKVGKWKKKEGKEGGRDRGMEGGKKISKYLFYMTNEFEVILHFNIVTLIILCY